MLQSVEDGNWIRADQMPFIFESRPRSTSIAGGELGQPATGSSFKDAPSVPLGEIKQRLMSQRMTGKSSSPNVTMVVLVVSLFFAVVLIIGTHLD